MNTCPQNLRHQNFASARRLEDPRALPWRRFGEVQRTQDPRLAVDECRHVALVEGMIAQRQAIGPGVQQPSGMGGRQARAIGGILAIHHHEIQPPRRAKPLQTVTDRIASRPADHVAKKQYPHGSALGCGASQGKPQNQRPAG